MKYVIYCTFRFGAFFKFLLRVLGPYIPILVIADLNYKLELPS